MRSVRLGPTTVRPLSSRAAIRLQEADCARSQQRGLPRCELPTLGWENPDRGTLEFQARRHLSHRPTCRLLAELSRPSRREPTGPSGAESGRSDGMPSNHSATTAAHSGVHMYAYACYIWKCFVLENHDRRQGLRKRLRRSAFLSL